MSQQVNTEIHCDNFVSGSGIAWKFQFQVGTVLSGGTQTLSDENIQAIATLFQSISQEMTNDSGVTLNLISVSTTDGYQVDLPS